MNAASNSTPQSSLPICKARPEQRRHNPPTSIRLLLPVWGRNYIRQFLEMSLPTLLAPGNIPALAKSLPCALVILTDSSGADLLKSHPGIQYLQGICDVEFSVIDDLITGDNYSTTITLAYVRAVEAVGPAMVDTCFFFLISDYVMADGSLERVLRRIHDGYSGVFAGNFQVVEKDAQESFFSAFDNGEPAIVLAARDLVRWAFKYLHPMTISNTVNFPLCHSSHSNRLFWRVDDATLIGRFYLMHMICIRPEVTDFVIGASCDYSFMPEMCPSDNVYVVTDSDEYFVVEMQPQWHESNFLRLGAVNQDSLVESLAEWTTARHRANAHSVVLFHAGKPSSELATMVAESAEYIAAVEKKLPNPQPHRNHPYWIGAITAHLAATRRKDGGSEPEAPERVQVTTRGYRALLYKSRDLVFGRTPDVRPWHPRRVDYKMLTELTRRHFATGSQRVLVVSDTPEIFQSWTGRFVSSVSSFDIERLFALNEERYLKMIGAFDGCLLVLRQSDMGIAGNLINRICQVLIPGSSIIVFVLNGHGLAVGREFAKDIFQNLDKLFSAAAVLDEVLFVRAGWLTWVSFRALRNALVLTMKNRLYLPVAALAGCGFLLVSLAGNLFRGPSRQPEHNALFSSVAMLLHTTSLPDSSQAHVENQQLFEMAAKRFEPRVRLARIDQGL